MMFLLMLFTCASCFTLAALVLSRNSAHPAHRAMSFLSLCLAAWSLTNWLSLQDFSLAERFFWVQTVMAVTIPIPWLFLQFSLHFPSARKLEALTGRRRIVAKHMPALLIWTLLLMASSFTPLMFGDYRIENGVPVLRAGVGAVAYGLTFVSLSLLGTGFLFRTYKWQTGLARQQSSYALLGLVLTVVVGFISNFVLVTIFHRFDFIEFGPASSLFFIGCVSYSMLRHRLLDLRFAVLRCIAYVSTLLVITVLYCFVLSDVFNQLSTYLPMMSQRTTTTIGTIGALLSFPFLLTFLQRTTQRIFYRSMFQPKRAQQILSQIIANTVSVKKLFKEIDGFFCTQLGVEWSGIVMRNGDQSLLRVSLQELFADDKSTQLIVFDELDEGQLKAQLRQQNIMLVIPLQLHHKILGWVYLGPKHSGDAFSVEELSFCEVVAPQIALATDHLDQLDQMKDEFVSIASHELRTPMTAIKSYLWLCLFKPSMVLPDTVRQHLHIAYSATERLLELVRDLLTLSQIEAQQLPLKEKEVSLEELVRKTLAEVEPIAATKSIVFRVESAARNTSCVIDEVKVGEILHNLIGNAVKFSPKHGQVSIVIGGTVRQLTVSVTDEGPGISESDQERLFQKFGIIQRSYQKSPESGTGLGLYISQQFAKLHHGFNFVRSQLGHGATFTLSLPRKQTPPAIIPIQVSKYAKAALTATY